MRAEVITITREPSRAAAAPSAELTGVVVATHDGEPFGGVDKGLIPISGRSLIKRVLEQLVVQVRQIIIVTNRNAALYATQGYRVVNEPAESPGGLASIAAGLAAIQTSHALFVPVDAAKLPRDLGQSLWQVYAQRQVPCLVNTGASALPSCCLLARSDLPDIQAALANGTTDALQWLRSRHAIEVDFSDWPAQFWGLPGPEAVKPLERALRP